MIDHTGYNLYNACMTGREMVRLLKENGWKVDRVSGGHYILVKGQKTLSVPVHGKKDLKKGTQEALLKQGGLK
jgi:predicted RNA binding protein YcfA (HicA-like mRNA interferase family)